MSLVMSRTPLPPPPTTPLPPSLMELMRPPRPRPKASPLLMRRPMRPKKIFDFDFEHRMLMYPYMMIMIRVYLSFINWQV